MATSSTADFFAMEQADGTEVPSLVMRGFGLLVASLLPAVFWTVVAAHLGWLLGADFEAGPLALLGLAIALFLAAVCGPIMLRGCGQRLRELVLRFASPVCCM